MANLINRLIDNSGMSQSAVSRITGIPLMTINRYYLGQSKPNYKKFLKIISACGYSFYISNDPKRVVKDELLEILKEIEEIGHDKKLMLLEEDYIDQEEVINIIQNHLSEGGGKN